jgi:hypothetical protein
MKRKGLNRSASMVDREERATCTLEEDTNPCLPAIEKLGVPKSLVYLQTPRIETQSKNKPKYLA